MLSCWHLGFWPSVGTVRHIGALEETFSGELGELQLCLGHCLTYFPDRCHILIPACNCFNDVFVKSSSEIISEIDFQETCVSYDHHEVSVILEDSMASLLQTLNSVPGVSSTTVLLNTWQLVTRLTHRPLLHHPNYSCIAKPLLIRMYSLTTLTV